MYSPFKMTGQSPRHGNRFSKTPPFLLPGLLVVIVILSFNYWRTSRLNKELLENVAMAEVRYTKLDRQFKEAEDLGNTEKKIKSDLEQELRSLKEDLAGSEATVKRLNGELDTMKEERDTLQDKNRKLEEEKNNEVSSKENLNADLQLLQSEVGELKSSVAEYNASAFQLGTEKQVIVNYIAEQLGKEGLEYVVNKHILIPNDVVWPSADQEPLCVKNAKLKFEASAANKQYVNPIDNDQPMQSPNAENRELQTQDVNQDGVSEIGAGKDGSIPDVQKNVISNGAGEEKADKQVEAHPAINEVPLAGNDLNAKPNETVVNNPPQDAVETKDQAGLTNTADVQKNDEDVGDKQEGEKGESGTPVANGTETNTDINSQDTTLSPAGDNDEDNEYDATTPLDLEDEEDS